MDDAGKGHAVRRGIMLLLATYNGGQFLGKQIDSLAAQTVDDIDILVSDDGSADRTLEVLRTRAAGWPKGGMRLLEGPGRGFAENFRHLVHAAGDRHAYYAFCDQDDVWHRDKLARALAWHARQDAGRPALYCTRTRLVDADGAPIGLSPLFPHPPGFRNALVQSLAGGNTMVLNAAAFDLLGRSLERTGILMHDWWSYLIVSGAGGVVHYDPAPSLDYRQHGGNAIGGAVGLWQRPARLLALLGGRYTAWSDANLAALDRCAPLLTPDARAAVGQFKAVRAARGPAALARLRASGLYRQTRKGNVAMWAAAFLGKL